MKKIILSLVMVMTVSMLLMGQARLPLPGEDEVGSFLTAPQRTEKPVNFNNKQYSADLLNERALGIDENIKMPDVSGVFSNLENLTKGLYSNFQNAVNIIKELKKRHQMEKKKYIARITLLEKQSRAYSLTINKLRNENRQLQSSKTKLEQDLVKSNSYIQNLKTKYNQLLQKLSKIKSFLE